MEAISHKMLEKSIEAFIMAIEIYNKPTLRYRVEGFSFFICNAWELMLKAYLIESQGEKSIYYAKQQDRTITLSNCIEMIFTNDKDPVRINLERIVELRNTSTHFITEEYEQIYIPLFQSCVINYTNKMLQYFNKDVTENIPSNFLTLSVKISPVDPQVIQARYPKQIASHLLKTQQNIIDSVPENGNSKYAVLIRHDMYITKKSELATATISITKNAAEAAYILRDVKDKHLLCPYNRKQSLELINRWIKRDHLDFINPSKQPEDERLHIFTSSHFDLIVKFYGVKNEDKYCYKYTNGKQTLYTYSEAALLMIYNEIKKDPENIIKNIKGRQKDFK